MARVRVEDCLCLDMVVLASRYPLRPGFEYTYYFCQADRVVGMVTWEVIDDCLCFQCRQVGPEGNWVWYPYWVQVSYTETQFGGRRAWFRCPGCDQRVRKLFRPPGGNTDFKCRACHDLTYTSQQRQRSPEDTVYRLLFDRESGGVGRPRWLAAFEEKVEILRARVEAAGRPPEDLASMPKSGELSLYPPPGRPKLKRPYHRTRPFARGERKSPSERLCMRCRDYREIEDPQPVTLPNGRPALKGHCPVCGAKMTVITKGG